MQYCTTCGHAFGADPKAPKTMSDVQAPPAGAPKPAVTTPAPAPTPTPPNPASDFHAPTAAEVLDLRSVQPQPTAKPTSPSTGTESAAPPPTPIPTPTPIAVAVTPSVVSITPAAESPAEPPTPTVELPPVAAKSVSAPTPPTPTPAASATTISGSRKQARLANAQTVSQSSQIKRFHTPAASPVPPTPTADAGPLPPENATVKVTPLPTPSPSAPIPTPVPTPAAVPIPTPTAPAAVASPPIQPAPPPAEPATLATPAPVNQAMAQPTAQVAPNPPPVSGQPAAAGTSAVMPGIVATTVEANKRLLTPAAMAQADPETARKEAFALAMANAPQRNAATSMIAASVAVLIMGGYIWLQNAPKLAVRTASAKAGFEASLPTYMPSNYSLQKQVSASPGRISLAFAAPDNSTLTVTQQKTSWDSKSLLDNYVSKQTNQYLAVAGQGLTIYIYNGDVASWVNRGIWYSIQGNNQLNREQLLKIAYGL